MSNDSVKVALRIRPLVPSEITKGCKGVLNVYPEIRQVQISGTDKAFTYNYIFDTTSTQDEVYDNCVKPMVHNIFKGYNLTVLAYGQTGSGKTHTMGTTYSGEGEMGVIPRAVTDIFNYVRDDFLHDFIISVSFMELYQETLYDLLSDKSRDQNILDIREDANKGTCIPGLTQIPVHKVKDVFDELTKGSRCRATGCTNMNAQSSRSHAIFTVNLVMQNKHTGDEKCAKFHLVDLAGSERPKKTGAVGTTFKEGVNINKGLLVLGNVISALGDEKQHNFVPYRDSNLTRLLKDSLGGNSITLMVACVSPADYNVEETVSTLRYADRARKIQNKPVVNQDPRSAEINLLKRTIQDLKLQIVGQGGPAFNSDEINKAKEENLRLQNKIRDLTVQLSSTLKDNFGFLEKITILQNANETLHKKILEIKAEYDLTLDNINVSFNANDQEAMKKHLSRLIEIKEQFVVIDTEQKKTENEILSHEQNIDLHNSQNGSFTTELDLSKDQESFNNMQIALNSELQEITKKLAIKEHLARQITTNIQHLVDYKAIAENEEKISTLQKEKDELLRQVKSAQGSCNTTKISEQRRKRVQELESQIHDLNKKVQEQARLIKMKEKDVKKINLLNGEITQMKQTRVKLIKKMREESERFRTWKIQRERELAKLKQQDRKKQNQIAKMEVMHSKQQNVLKRKVEEAVALNKRLKDALALRKANQDSKSAGKVDKVGYWVKQEFDVHMHLIEAEATLAGLLEDRATLQQQMDKLTENPEADKEEIQNLQEDIELRSIQIQDLQQKLLDSEEDNKKSKFDNLQTMADAKFAVKLLLEQAAEIKKKEVTANNKLLEVQGGVSDIKHRSDNLEKVMKIMECKHAEEISSLQKEYEEKTAVLLRQLRGVEVQNASEEFKQRCAIQQEKIHVLDKANQDLMERLLQAEEEAEALKQKLDTITNMAKESETIMEQQSLPVTPVNNNQTKKKKIRIKQEVDSTFILENQENMDASIDEAMDDVSKDPDWKRTPIGKWLIEKKRRALQRVKSDNNTSEPVKRTSEGGCSCVKGNCSKRCGCKKTNRNCTSHCKCSCANKDGNDTIPEAAQGTSDGDQTLDKRPKLLQQKLF